MDSEFTEDGQSPDEGADPGAALPFGALPSSALPFGDLPSGALPSGALPSRETGFSRAADMEARAEVRDRETYYTELRLAVHCQSRSIPAPRAALDNQETDTRERRPDNESWDDMNARNGDTWT